MRLDWEVQIREAELCVCECASRCHTWRRSSKPCKRLTVNVAA